MKKVEPAKIIVIGMVLITAVVAVAHLAARTTVPEGTLHIEYAGQALDLLLEKLELTAVQGTVVNGKGEERTVNAQGILLSEVLREAGITEFTEFSEVIVTADDEYSAVVTAEEIAEPDKVYLIRQDEGGMQLIVFGDSNSKRNVSGAARLSVR